MSTFSLTRGSEAALGMLASQAGSETLLLTQAARELRAELSIEPFTSDSGNQLLAVLLMREQRHSMTLQRDDGANVQHLADWIVAVANGTLDSAEAIPQRADPSDLAAATAAFHAAAHELNAQAEPATAQDETEPVYQFQWREIGEGDWMACSHSWFRFCEASPEHDTRVVEVARPAQTEQQPVGHVYTMQPCFPGEPMRAHAQLHVALPAGTKLYAAPIAPTAQQPEQSGLEQALALAAARLDRLWLNQPVHSKAYREARDWADEAMVALRDYRAALATSPTA
ncbi:MAG TPA: hypothetical protein DIC61_06545 [Pseudomonas sp.]|nr:hypothetical protein [Pseudomonas sp.]